MALVYGSEPSSARSYFSSYRRTTAVETNMTSSGSQGNKDSSQSTVSGPSSSPPIPIPPRKNSSLPTPNTSNETDRKTIDMMQGHGGHTFVGDLPPTPGDMLPEIPQRKPDPNTIGQETQRLLESLGKGDPRSRLKLLDERKLLELRASTPYPLTMDFPVDEALFREWDERLSDLGGYEYDARGERLIIQEVPGFLHEGVVEVFNDWFSGLKRDLLEEDVNLRLKGNQAYQLKGKYAGDRVVPDYSVSVVGKKAATVLEVGVSQPLQDLQDRAKKWLIGHQVQLAILVNIQIDTLAPDEPSFSSTHGDGSLSGFPYELRIEDLSSGDSESVGEKIIEWYKAKGISTPPSTPLIKLLEIGIYIYRHDPSHKGAIKQDNEETILFKSETGFHDLKIGLTPKDLGITSVTPWKEFNLPLDKLKEHLYVIIEEHSTSVAEERADQVLQLYGYGDKKDPNYHDSPEQPVISAFPPRKRPSKPATQSSSRTQPETEDPKQVVKGRKKRKRGQEGIASSDVSFSMDQADASFTTTSTGLFDFESDMRAPDLTTSTSSSFSKAAAAAIGKQRISELNSSMSVEPPPSGQEPSRRRRRKGKGKAS